MEVVPLYCFGFIYFVDIGGEDQIDMGLASSPRGKIQGEMTHPIGQQGVNSKNDP